MKKRFNRAFTITELVIVIAVVAILAAVLIPTFANIINKSNQSADTQNLKSMNSILSAKQTIEGKPTTMQEAVEIILANGYVFEKLIASSDGYDIVWDQENNRLAMLSGDEVIYSEGEVSKEKSKLWLVVDEQIETEYSVYLSEKFDADVFNANAGVDVGNNSDINVNITTDATNDFIVRTNGGNVNVNAKNANIAHYGFANAIDITAVANNSYHEYGTVEGNISIVQGRFVAEQGSQAAALVVKAESTDNVKIELSDKAEVLNIAATNSDVASNLGSIVSGATENVTIEEDVFNEESIGLFAGGLGTETSPYLIENEEQFISITSIDVVDETNVLNEIKYYKLLNDIVLTKLFILRSSVVVIDMNEKTLTSSADLESTDETAFGEIWLNGDAELIINGNGYFTFDENYMSSDYSYGYTFNVAGNSRLTLNSGNYYGGFSVVQAADNSVVNIKGGVYETFYLYNIYWVLNLIDDSEAKFIVSGGEFINFDPSNAATESPAANFLADGYKVVKEEIQNDNDVIYRVVKE